MKRKLFGFIMSCAFLFGLSAVSWGAVRPASAPTPANEATEVVCNTTIKWTGTDTTASDDVTYAIYLGTNESAPAYLGSIRTVSQDLTNPTFEYAPPVKLLPLTTYYWKIVTSDAYGNVANSPTWVFITGNTFPDNQYEPYPATDPSPDHGAVYVAKNAVLSWTGKDPNIIGGDTSVKLYYEVRLGTSLADMPIVTSSGKGGTISVNQYVPTSLAANTKYYWQVNSINSYKLRTNGPVWEFTVTHDPWNDPSGGASEGCSAASFAPLSLLLLAPLFLLRRK